MKECKGCKEKKPLDQFHRRALNNDGHVNICAECSNAEARSKYKEKVPDAEPQTPAQSSDSGLVSGFMEEVAAAPQFTDKKTAKNLSLQEMLQAYINQQDFREELSIRQLTANAKIAVKEPIAVSFVTDAHIGSPYCAYQALLSDLTAIKAHPRHYVCFGGDMTDNFQAQFKDKSAPMGQLQPPQIQLLTLEKIFEFMQGRVVAAIGGNHDKMDEKQTGASSRYMIQRNQPFPYMPHGGLLTLMVGKIEYSIVWKHQWRFNSALNKFNAHHRINDLLYQADVTVMEHQHDPGMETLERGEYDQRRTAISIRTGSYKADDPFSMEFFKAGRRAPQTIILFPNSKKIWPCHGEDAIGFAQSALGGLK